MSARSSELCSRPSTRPGSHNFLMEGTPGFLVRGCGARRQVTPTIPPLLRSAQALPNRDFDRSQRSAVRVQQGCKTMGAHLLDSFRNQHGAPMRYLKQRRLRSVIYPRGAEIRPRRRERELAAHGAECAQDRLTSVNNFLEHHLCIMHRQQQNKTT